MDEGIEEAILYSYNALVPFAILTSLVAVPLGVVYLVYPQSILQLYLRIHPYLIGGFTAKSIRIKGHNISYLERPSNTKRDDEVTMVMFHGFTSSKNSNVDMAKHFPSNWRIIFPDLPAHGDSSYVPNSDYSVYGLVDILHEFFVLLDLKDVHLTGQSLGAFVAAQFARRHSHLIKSLTLLCPPVEISKKSYFWHLYYETGRNLFLPETTKELDEMFKFAFYKQPFTLTTQLKHGILSIMKPKYPGFAEVFISMLRSKFDREECLQCLKEITVPVFSMFGDNDGVVLLEDVKDFHQSASFKNVEMKIIEKCGHAISVEHPYKAAAEITRFITKHSTHSC